MARLVTAFEDNRGNLHKVAETATKADLAQVLRGVGEGGGLSDGLAGMLIEKRHELEHVFAEHDAMISEPVQALTEQAKPEALKLVEKA